MAFRDLVSTAKKNTPDRTVPTGINNPKNLIEAAREEKTAKKSFERQTISYTDSEIKGFVPGARQFASRNTTNNPAHGSIIRNIASQSNTNQQTGGNATWEECRHLKKSDFGKEYCAEYHSLCAKDKCRKARK